MQLSAFLKSEVGRKVVTRLLFGAPQASNGKDAAFDAGLTKGWTECIEQLTFLSTPESSTDAQPAAVRPVFPDSIDDESQWDGVLPIGLSKREPSTNT